jgi:pimeloyl-ACP methyl ester carboxylesterase
LSVHEAEVEFESGKDICRAWLFAPDQDDEPRPCIVMAHGFGLTRRSGLRAFAKAFASVGYFALVFDYRCFGDSGGMPRQVISFRRQLEDWECALAFARTLPDVDRERVVTWGFSLGGGHAITTAAQDGAVAAVVAVAPMVSGLSSTWAAMKWWSLLNMVRIVARGIHDLLSGLLGRRPVTVPLTAPSGEIGLLTSPDAYPGYRKIVPEGFDFETGARIALRFWSYAPGRFMRRLAMPVLVLPSVVDAICPPRPTIRHARRSGNAEFVELPCEHMECAVEPYRGFIIDATLDFLRRHVPVR